ncbi:MAG: hypothetical protein JW889_14980 [Verrucomicrobia bacterium]|nr:hypothetical protein [Verrucomicrobiota bacterium]
MSGNESSPLQLPRGVGDRILIVLLSPFIMLFSSGFALVFLRKPSDTATGLLTNMVAFELFFSVFCLSSLSLLWGLFAPKWVEAALDRTARKVALLLAIPVFGLLVAVVYLLVLSPS